MFNSNSDLVAANIFRFLTLNGAIVASAALALSEDMFVAADDENNILRVYKTGKARPPVFSYEITEFLGIEQEHPEADIDGAMMIAERIYWITSHQARKKVRLCLCGN